MRAVVLGASGQIGYAVCRALLDKGHEVVACHRGSRELQSDLKRSGCREVVGERHASDALARALASGGDVLVDVVPMVAADAEQLLSAAAGFGAIVAVSSGAVYADEQGRSLGSASETGFPEYPEVIHETQATVEPDADSYAGRKAAIERRLLDHSPVNTTVLRPCAVHGAFARDLREVWFLKRLVDGRRFVPLAYDGTSRFHTCAAATIAQAVLGSVAAGGTRILNVADGNAPTVREIGEIVLPEGTGPELLCFAGPPRNGVGRSPWSVPFPICLDTSALAALIGRPPLYQETVPPTAAWALEHIGEDWTQSFPKLAAYPFPLFDYEAEDAVLGSLS